MISNLLEKTISKLVNLRDRLSSRKQGNKSNVSLFRVFEKKMGRRHRRQGEKSSSRNNNNKINPGLLTESS